MVHLLILCEGHTEQGVLRAFLSPYWKQRFDTSEVVNYGGSGALKMNFKGDSEHTLRSEPETSVLCLVDLYNEPFGVYDRQKMSVEEGFQAVRGRMVQQVESRLHPRFGAFPVVMEIETWLLADPNIQRELGLSIDAPESISHPVSTLEQSYKARNQQYGKVIDGAKLFRKASAIRVYEDACPHFRLMVDWLVNPPSIVTDPQSEAVKAKLKAWETERDRLYDVWTNLETRIETDAQLDAAIEAEHHYNDHLASYAVIFQRPDA